MLVTQNLSDNLKTDCEENSFYINQHGREYLINSHLRGIIDWKNIDLSKYSILDEISIHIYDLQNDINFSEYKKNLNNFKNHFRKCIETTYQTFGIKVDNNILNI